ncbi:YhdP family phospholipid transporter [Eionea flava]
MSQAIPYKLRFFLGRLFFIVAIVIVCLAVFLQAARLLTSYAHHGLPSIEKTISTHLNANLSIGRLQAQWVGLSPHFIVEDITLRGANTVVSALDTQNNSQSFLNVRYAEIQIDLIASIINREWAWEKLSLRDADVYIQQNHQKQWLFAGFLLSSNDRDSLPYSDFLRWSDYIPDVEIENVRINIAPLNSDETSLLLPRIHTENSENSHFQRLTAELVINENPSVELVFERNANLHVSDETDKAKATVHVSFSDILFDDLADLFSAFLPNRLAASIRQDKSFLQSTFSGQVWLDFLSNDRLKVIASSKALLSSDHFVGKRSIPLSILVGGDVNRAGDITIRVDQPTVDGQALLSDVVITKSAHDAVIKVEQLDLQSLSVFAKKYIVLSHDASRVLALLSPKGRIHSVQIDVDPQDFLQSVWQFEADNFSIDAFDNIPALSNITGYVRAQGLTGVINIESKNVGFWPAKIYDEPIVFDELLGQVAWDIDTIRRDLWINSNVLSGLANFGRASGEFLLNIPLDDGPRKSDFSLSVGLVNSKADYHALLTPNKVPENVRAWLRNSIKAGEVSQAGFVYRGGFSGDSNTRSFQLAVDMQNTDMEYSQDWPSLTGIDGHLLVDNQSIVVNTKDAQLFDETVDSLSIAWPGDGQRQLNVRSATRLSAQSGLRLLTETPLRERFDGLLDDVSVAGDIETLIDVWIPIVESEKSTVRKSENTAVENSNAYEQSIVVNFLTNDINVGLSSLPNIGLSQVEGALSYSNLTGVSSSELAMQVLNEPLQVKLQTSEADTSRQLVLTGEGVASPNAILQWLNGSGSQRFSGRAPYQLSLTMPFNDGDKLSQPVSDQLAFTMTSTLEGILVDLPKPFNKAKQVKDALTINVNQSVDSSEYRVTLGNTLNAKFSQQHKKANTASGFLLVNDTLSAPVADNVFVVSAKVDQLDVEQWLAVKDDLQEIVDIEKYSSPTDAMRLLYDVSMGALLTEKHTLNNVSVSGERVQAQWRSDVSHELFAAELTVHDDPLVPNNAYFRYLTIPKKAPDEKREVLDTAAQSDFLAKEIIDPLAGVDLSWLKLTNVSIDKLYYGEESLGQWRFSLQPVSEGIEVNELYAKAQGINLHGNDLSQGATLLWQQSNARTTFRGRLTGTHVEALFTRLGAPALLTSQVMAFDADLSWAGSPATFAIEKMSGTLDVELREGIFSQGAGNNASGILRLLGLFNFNTWARRMRLDFSDFYQKGLAYDQLTARLLFDRNNIYFQQPLIVKAPSSEFTMAGKIDSSEENIDAVLVTTLPVGGNLTFATALVAGLPAAVGVFIINKIFKSQVDKVSSLTYSVKGNWAEPKLEFINIFDNNPYIDDSIDSDASLNERGLN